MLELDKAALILKVIDLTDQNKALNSQLALVASNGVTFGEMMENAKIKNIDGALYASTQDILDYLNSKVEKKESGNKNKLDNKGEYSKIVIAD